MTSKPPCEELETRIRKSEKEFMPMKTGKCLRILSILAAILFLLCPIRADSAVELSKDEQAYLREKGTIVFVSQTRYPPFEFVDKNGERTGMCIELARWMATELGFTAQFTDTSFQKAQRAILSGEADVLTSLFYSEKRDKSFDFTQVIFEVPASIFVRAERPDIKDLRDLSGKRIAMQEGDYAREFLESRNISFEVVYTKDFAEATDLVIANKADVIIGDEQIVLYHIFKNNLTDRIKKVGEPLYVGQDCMAARESNPVLIGILNKGINLAKESGALEKINRKWIGTRYALRESLLSRYFTHLAVVAGIIFMLALLVWFWNIRLRREVDRRTSDLRESEHRFHTIFDSVNDVIFVHDIDTGAILDVNRKMCEMFGYTREEALNLGAEVPKSGIPPYTQEDAIRWMKKAAGGEPQLFEWLAKDKNGREIWVEVDMRRAVIGNRNRLLVVARDISERKRVEEALRESEEKYRLLVENANDAIFIIQDGVVKFHNKKTEELIEYSAEELRKIPFVTFYYHEDRKMILERRRRRENGEIFPNTYRVRMIKKSGEELRVELSVAFITWEGKPATINFFRDITHQEKLEIQLQQVQKMKSIGTLAGGIAHDFNNLLMGIQGRCSLMMTDTNSLNPYFEHLKGIEGYVKSATELTKQLLGFARGGKYELKPTDLNKIVKDSLEMFGRTKKEIAIHSKYQEGIWTAEIDRGQIEQVLLNLYVNAWQAMPGGGKLYLQTENITLDKSSVKPFTIESGRYVKVSVTDTGVGMDESTRQRIFDPFFTTREISRGTGLGLASAYGIINNHGGFINVYSEKGEGTTFNFYLPASTKEIIEERELSEEVYAGTETILLVDDEEMIIDVGKEILKTLGYKVLTANSGKEAAEFYKKNSRDIDMVILDMIMPDMDGGETFDRLKEINPDIKVLLSSGYSIDGRADEILERGCNGFIQKPFNIKQLSQKLREILEEEKPLTFF